MKPSENVDAQSANQKRREELLKHLAAILKWINVTRAKSGDHSLDAFLYSVPSKDIEYLMSDRDPDWIDGFAYHIAGTVK